MNIERNDLRDSDGYGNRIPPVTIALICIAAVLCGTVIQIAPLALTGVLLIAVQSGSVAFLCRCTGQFWPYLLALPSYGAAYLAGGDAVNSIGAVLFLPCAAALALSTKKKQSRSMSVIWLCAAFAAGCIVYIVFYFIFRQGGLSLKNILSYFDSAKTLLSDSLAQLDAPSEIVTSMLNGFIMLTPSLAVYFLMFCAYLSQMIYVGLARLFRAEGRILPDVPWKITMSVISAYIFAGFYIISVLFRTADATPLSVTADNIISILKPGFAIVGFRYTVQKIRQRNSNFTFSLTVVAGIALFFISPDAFFTLLAFWGVIETIIKNLKKE